MRFWWVNHNQTARQEIAGVNNGELIISPVAHRPSLRRMGVDTERIVNVGRFSEGQRHFLDYHRDAVLLEQCGDILAQALMIGVRNGATIDWTMKDLVRARMRVMVKRILRKYGCPPDKKEKAVETVLEQATVLCGEWAA